MKKLLAIVGPTGTGKTDLAIKLAKKFDGEIVSADSRQIYIGMDIGTGKLDASSKTYNVGKNKESWLVDGITVHLYDLITPAETFSVAKYQQLAYKKIAEIESKNKLPILVGGSGLYVQSVTEGLNMPKLPPDKDLRNHLESQPFASLIRKLEEVDPETAEKIDRQNLRRVVRALEVYAQSGTPISKLKKKYKADFDALKVGLSVDRESLYRRLDERIDRWFAAGFLQEVEKLIKDGYKDTQALNTLGYRQAVACINKKISLNEAKKRIKFEHHNLVRKQITWFKKDKLINWFDIDEDNLEERSVKKVEDWLSK